MRAALPGCVSASGPELEPLYRALGWTEVGQIPGYSKNAHGGFDATVLSALRR